MRTLPYALEKPAGTTRMLTLGDSFTFSSGGVPFEAMWNTRVADAFAAMMGRPVELINLGVPAAGVRLEQRVFAVEGAKLQPDLVIVGLFVGNDFTDEALERPRIEWRWHGIRLLRSLSRFPALREAAKSGSPYMLRNTHWNEKGNAVAAEAVMEFVQNEWPEVFRGVPGGI